MNFFNNERTRMRREPLALVKPASESLFALSGEKSYWPEAIRQNSKVLDQISARFLIYTVLDQVFSDMTDSTQEITEALDQKKLDTRDVFGMYALLNNYLEDDPIHQRLILYLPFEIIPAKRWRSGDKELDTVIQEFHDMYLACWYQLLKETDVRANFVDGNILEPEISPFGQPQVRKAAHLIPWLLQKQIISVPKVLELYKSDDELLKNSIADTLPMLVEMGFLPRAEYEQYAGVTRFTVQKLTRPDRRNAQRWMENLAKHVEKELSAIEIRSVTDEMRGVPLARVIWQQKTKREALIEQYATEIAVRILSYSIGPRELEVISETGPERILRLASIVGLRKAIEQRRSIFHAYGDTIRSFLRDGKTEIYDAVMSLYARLVHGGIIQPTYLRRIGIHVPELGNFTSDLYTIEPDIPTLKSVVNKIASDPLLKKMVYPVLLLFGSRLKGYGGSQADLDVAVFVRPGVSYKKRLAIQSRLRTICNHPSIDGKIVEFWLTEDSSYLSIRDFANPEVTLADSTWVHILFAGLWLGRSEAITELHARLLPWFLQNNTKTYNGHPARKVWLNEMEREVLQYRLMHKGYRRLYPERGGVTSPNAKGIDPQSSFWDSGYRRIATKLFIARVFLPQLDK